MYPHSHRLWHASHDSTYQIWRLSQMNIYFCLCPATYGILVPWPGLEPVPPGLGEQSLGHWTTKEVPLPQILKLTYFFTLGELLYAAIFSSPRTFDNWWCAWNTTSGGERFPATGEILGILELQVLDAALVPECGTKEMIYFVQCTSEQRNTPFVPRQPGEIVPVSVCCRLPSE